MTTANEISAPFRTVFGGSIPATHVEAVKAAFRATCAVAVQDECFCVFVYQDGSAVVIEAPREEGGPAYFRPQGGEA